MFEARS